MSTLAGKAVDIISGFLLLSAIRERWSREDTETYLKQKPRTVEELVERHSRRSRINQVLYWAAASAGYMVYVLDRERGQR